MSQNEPLSVLTYAVRGKLILKYTAQLTLIQAILVTIPVLVSLRYGEYTSGFHFLVIAAALAGLSLPWVRLPTPTDIQINEAMYIAAISFLIGAGTMVYPFIAGGIPFVDSVFEAVSGITTTGLSTLSKQRSFSGHRHFLNFTTCSRSKSIDCYIHMADKESPVNGPSQELIQPIVELKQRNSRFGCHRIAQQINKAFGINIDKDVVRHVLEKHYHPHSDDNGPSWLTFIRHTKDSLWSIDLFRCESILLNTHWGLVVMDQFTRRITGFGVHAGDVDGVALCQMFNTAISTRVVPKHLSSDNDPLQSVPCSSVSGRGRAR